MKTKTLLSISLFTFSFFLILSLTGLDSPDKKFLIVTMHSGVDTTSLNYSRMKDSLGMNGWHRYGSWFTGDQIDADTSFLAPRVRYRVDQNNQRDLRTVFGRRITDYLAWGQRSDYQCEQISAGQPYWFYSYNTSLQNSWIQDVPDSCQIVKRCLVNTTSPGSNAAYIVQGLKANREQANRYWTMWQSDSLSDWYVKPRIRIPTGLPNSTPVCRIEILNWDGDTVKSVNLTAENFKDGFGNYDGNYMEDFYFPSNPGVLSTIKIDSSKLCPGELRKKFWDWRSTNDTNTIKTDFRVYWYGLCDMWIDRIRVENEQARLLFEDPFKVERIKSEVNSAMLDYDESRPNDFYLEEFEFNTTPCIRRVREIIEEQSQGKLTLIANLNLDLYNAHVPQYNNNRFTGDDFMKYFVDSSGIKKIAVTHYFLEGFPHPSDRNSKNPVTLPVYSVFPTVDYDPGKGLLTYKKQFILIIKCNSFTFVC